VQAVWLSIIEDAESLITEPGGNPVSPQQRGEKMAFGVAVAGPVMEHLGSAAGDGIHFVINAVPDLVPDPLKASLGDRLGNSQITRYVPGQIVNCGMAPIDNVARLKKLFHLGRRHTFLHRLHTK
jgi:hypothetical protein